DEAHSPFRRSPLFSLVSLFSSSSISLLLILPQPSFLCLSAILSLSLCPCASQSRRLHTHTCVASPDAAPPASLARTSSHTQAQAAPSLQAQAASPLALPHLLPHLPRCVFLFPLHATVALQCYSKGRQHGMRLSFFGQLESEEERKYHLLTQKLNAA
ncbi:hypothetical protein Taro_004298, partial [Colocasia esculenta]|nr:hypothetical protein [Colocasia esculenta]